MEKAFAVGVYNMKAMKKISSAGIVAAMIIVFYVYASFLSTAHKQDAGKQLDLQVTASCVITEPKMGDAKLISDKIVSGTDGHMIVFQENGSVFREYPDIPLYWLYVYENERMVVAAGGENELRLVQMNDDWTVKSNQAINIRGGVTAKEALKIDPTIVKAGDVYVLTYTQIEGTVNNADADAENGVYTVKCMRSEDAVHWTQTADIVTYKNNIEDGDMVYVEQSGELYYFFEKELYDKGPSSICVIRSKNGGLTWENEMELLPADADQELAAAYAADHGFCIYYSSDCEQTGASYEGAKIYRAVFDEDFSLKEVRWVDIEEKKGILLYDVRGSENGVCYLYVQNYLTENDLVLKKAGSG